ncbi:hypothetical protein FRB96_008458 [Tulasnella sp. 330]|nr:hypothetical protein FRB96_008458 [Tulasnella sp. 330]KAG8883981.1 hypothetical protein FRB97_005425 [Tulasnella sp. 331]
MLSAYRVHVIQSKLEPSTYEYLLSLTEAHGAKITSIDEANVVITTIHARKRLQRHIDDTTALGITIVTPKWLTDSVLQARPLPFKPYNAVKSSPLLDLGDESFVEPSLVKTTAPSPRSSLGTSVGPDELSPSSASPRPSSSLASTPSPIRTTKRPTPENSRYAVHRRTPLKSPNEPLLEEIGLIMKSRSLDGNARSALSYSRAISVEEYVRKGSIAEARKIANSPRFQALSLFSTVYTVGPTTARHFYDDLSIFTLDDLEAYAEQLPEDEPSSYNLRTALHHREDFAKKMSRAEVEAIAKVVEEHMNALEPGAQYTICGGGSSKRAKFDSLDKALTTFRLPSGYFPTTSTTTAVSKGDDFEESRLPPLRPVQAGSDTTTKTMNENETVPLSTFDPGTPYRRVDLVFAPPEAYWTAVVGWYAIALYVLLHMHSEIMH